MWGPSVGPGPKPLGRAGARAVARAGRHSIKGRGAVGGAPRNPRRRPRRGGKFRLKSGFPRKDPRENLCGWRAQPAAPPGGESSTECALWRGGSNAPIFPRLHQQGAERRPTSRANPSPSSNREIQFLFEIFTMTFYTCRVLERLNLALGS